MDYAVVRFRQERGVSPHGADVVNLLSWAKEPPNFTHLQTESWRVEALLPYRTTQLKRVASSPSGPGPDSRLEKTILPQQTWEEQAHNMWQSCLNIWSTIALSPNIFSLSRRAAKPVVLLGDWDQPGEMDPILMGDLPSVGRRNSVMFIYNVGETCLVHGMGK